MTRVILGLAASAVAFGAIAYASSRLYWITLRETHRAAEWVGIMDPNGDLGGQVAGFNYQRHPRWVYSVGQVAGAAVAFGPGLVVSLLVLERVGFGRARVSVCGKCGARMRGLKEPRCAACGVEF